MTCCAKKCKASKIPLSSGVVLLADRSVGGGLLLRVDHHGLGLGLEHQLVDDARADAAQNGAQPVYLWW